MAMLYIHNSTERNVQTKCEQRCLSRRIITNMKIEINETLATKPQVMHTTSLRPRPVHKRSRTVTGHQRTPRPVRYTVSTVCLKGFRELRSARRRGARIQERGSGGEGTRKGSPALRSDSSVWCMGADILLLLLLLHPASERSCRRRASLLERTSQLTSQLVRTAAGHW